MEKQIDEMDCKKCLHYEMCLNKFRRAKEEGLWELTDEEEYFGHADDCDMFITGYRKAPEVAEEIIKDLVKFADDNEKQRLINGHSVWFIDADDITDFIAELKKKYKEGGE